EVRPGRERVVGGGAAVVDGHVRAGVLDVEERAERVHAAARRRDEGDRCARQQREPGLGANRHGRTRRPEVGRGRRRHDRVARDAAAGRADGRVLQRTEVHRMVTSLTSLSWGWIALMATVPVLAGLLIAWPIWNAG